MKKNRVKRFLAGLLCFSMIGSTNLLAFAETTGQQEVQVVESTEETTELEAVEEPEEITEPEVVEEEPEEITEPEVVEEVTEEITEPEVVEEVTEEITEPEVVEEVTEEATEPEVVEEETEETTEPEVVEEETTEQEVVEETTNSVEQQVELQIGNHDYKIIDLENNGITLWKYQSMLTEMKNQIESNDGTNIPILNWRRSSNSVEVPKVGHGSNGDWKWPDVVDDLALDITDEAAVWDGSRLVKGAVNHVAKSEDYIKDNQITSVDGNLYDSATWDCGELSGGTARLFRFQGVFDIGNLNPNDYAFTIEPMITGGNKEIYINDDMFVFVYPVDENGSPVVEISDNNFLAYLAFWTGTIYNNGASEIDDVTEFHNISGTPASWDQDNVHENVLGKLTDGWNVEATEDNAGNIIQTSYNQGGYTRYAIDIFVDDYAGSGGMYRPVMTASYVEKHQIEFYKVDQYGEPLEGAEFELRRGSTRYTGFSDENGKVSITLVPGQYTMKEIKAPENCESLNENTKWKVVVGSNGGYTIEAIEHSNLKVEDNKYFIKNQSILETEISFIKTDEKGSPIKGVEFVLTNEEGGKESYTATSDENGVVKIVDVPKGTYTMKEKTVPEGYLKSGPWTVEVESGRKCTIDGPNLTTRNGQYQIMNYKFESSIQVDKKVEVVDYDQRTYEITLSAKSILSQIQQGEPVDIVLAVDTSRSMDFPGSLKAIGDATTFKSLDKSQTYYYIGTTSAATVYEVRYKRDAWYYKDSSNPDEEDEGTKITRNSDILQSDEKYVFYQSVGEATRLDYLKEALNNFINEFARISEENGLENRIGLVTFAEDSKIACELNTISENKEAILNAINGIVTASGTNQAGALRDANDMLTETENKQYVLLLTDGAPNWKENNHTVGGDEAWETIGVLAEGIKDKGATLMTIGVGLNYVEGAEAKLANIASEDSKGNPYAYQTENADNLVELFEGMLATIVTGIPVENVTITDIIDPRFQLVGELGDVNYSEDTGTLTWENVTIPYVISGRKGWEVKFTVQAKDDFMGGNVIPTNGAGSGVSKDGITIAFPQPMVNVKLLDLELPNLEIAYFKGDEIQVSEFPRELLNGSEIYLDVDNNNELTEGSESALEEQQVQTILNLTQEEWEAILQGKQVAKDYIYSGTTEKVGTFIYQFEAVDGKGELKNHIANQAGSPAEVYKLTIQYQADQKNGQDRIPGTAVKDVQASGQYQVFVIDGKIDIAKQILEVNPNLEGDAIFTFKIERLNEKGNAEEVFYRTIRMDQAGVMHAESLTGLAKGTYKITELETQKYGLNSIRMTERNIEESTPVNMEEKSITFTIGEQHIEKNVTGYTCKDQEAQVLFENEKDSPKSNTDTDVRLNRFVKKDGKWVIESYETPQNPDK